MSSIASLNKKTETEFQVGPMSVLQQSVVNHTQVLINCRNNKKLLGRVKSFDRHMNMILENVREMWVDEVRRGKGAVKKPLAHDRYIQKLFLRGDSIILVLKNPYNANTDH